MVNNLAYYVVNGRWSINKAMVCKSTP
jgi:hypothetical protein